MLGAEVARGPAPRGHWVRPCPWRPGLTTSTWLCPRASRPGSGSGSSWSLRLVFLVQENSASVSFGHRPCPFGSTFFHNFYETVTEEPCPQNTGPS